MTANLTGLLILLAAMAVESFAQLFLKVGAAGGPAVLRPGCRRLAASLPSAKSWVVLGVLAYGLEILLYTFALRFLDISVAFPLGSLCFVGVAVLSKVILGEVVGLTRWFGVGLILAGTCIVTL